MTSDALSMYNDLMSIIDEACLPREEQGAMNKIRNDQQSIYYASTSNTYSKYESFPAPYYYDNELQYCLEPDTVQYYMPAYFEH